MVSPRPVCQTSDVTPRRIGLLAGWGRYPLLVAAALKAQGYQVVTLGVKQHAPPELIALSAAYREIGIGKLGAAIRFFRQHQITLATMAGKFHKVRLFDRHFLWHHLPDWRCVRTFFPHFIRHTKDRKDDTLLGALIEAFAEDGIHFAPATDFAPELLVKSGTLTRRSPTAAEWTDIAFGWNLAKEMGRLDVGQSVVVKGQAVLAVEAIEGTDQCILRAGQLCPAGGFVVVKVAKPQQDMRFDVPTIGLLTLQNLVQAGGRVLAVEADKTILIDEPEVIQFANQHGLAIVGWRPEPGGGRREAEGWRRKAGG